MGPHHETRTEVGPGNRPRRALRRRSGARPGWPGFFGLLATAALAGCGDPDAAGESALEEDHTHGGGDVVTLWTDRLELFMEYPPQVAERQSEPWAVHLTWIEEWEPGRQPGAAPARPGPT